MHEIVIDIETVGAGEPLPLDQFEAPSTWKDPVKIEAKQRELQQAEMNKRALHLTRAQIVCVGLAVGATPVMTFTYGDERTVLESTDYALRELCGDTSAPKWIGHNIQSFDLPRLKIRAAKYGCRWLLRTLNGRPDVYDTMRESAGYRDFISLADLAEFYGFDPPEGDGSEVGAWWEAGEWSKIANHCERDVELTREIYRQTTAY